MAVDFVQSFRKHFHEAMAQEGSKQEPFGTKMMQFESLGIIAGIILIFSVVIMTPAQYKSYTIPVGVAIGAGIFKLLKTARQNRGKHYAYKFEKAVNSFFGEGSTYSHQPTSKADWLKYDSFHEYNFPKEGIKMCYTYKPGENNNAEGYVSKGFMVSWEHDFKTYGNIYVLRDKTEKYIGNLGVFFQRFNAKKPKLQRLEHPGFEKIYRVYSWDNDALKQVFTEDVQRLIYEWKAAPKLQFLITPTHIHVHYSNEREMLPAELYLIEKKYTKGIDSIALNYIDALKIRDSLVHMMGAKARKE